VTGPSRVLIADDHLMFRDGLTVLLNEGPATELAGTATNASEAVALALKTGLT